MLFRNSLRWRSRRSELAAQSIGYVVGALFVLGTSSGYFAATVTLLGNQRFNILDVLLWTIFLVWQLGPILFSGFSPGLDFREVARYPLSFRLYYILNTAYGMFDPAAIAGTIWLFSVWLGIVVARTEWALPAALIFLVFIVFNVVGNRILVALFDRFQSTRKGRERVTVLLLLLALLPQMIQFVVNGWIDVSRFHPPRWAPDLFAVLMYISPPGLVSRVISSPGTEKLPPLALLLSYLLVAALLLVRTLRRVYHGEVYAENFTVQRELKVDPGWQLPLLDAPISAIVEKELRYLRQNSRLLVQLFYPVVVCGLLLMGSKSQGAALFSRGPVLLQSFAGLMALSVSNLSYNTFGMDRDGFGRWLLAPLSLRKVIVGKSLAQGLIMAAIYLLGAIAISFARHIRWLDIISTTAAFLCVLVFQISVGNVISVYWPKRIELAKMSSRMTSQAAALVSLAVNLPLIAVIGGVVAATLIWKLEWLPLAASVVGLVLSLRLFFWLLNWAARYAGEHLEEITEKLGA